MMETKTEEANLFLTRDKLARKAAVALACLFLVFAFCMCGTVITVFAPTPTPTSTAAWKPTIVLEATAADTPTATTTAGTTTPEPVNTPTMTAWPTETPWPTPAPTQPLTTEPSGAGITLMSLTSPISAGANATLVIQVAVGAVCDPGVIYKSGESSAGGLESKTAGGDGQLSWTWEVGTRTTPGTWTVYVNCKPGGYAQWGLVTQ